MATVVTSPSRGMRRYALPGVLFLLGTIALPLLLLVRVSLCERGSGFYQSGTWTLEHYRSLARFDFVAIAATTMVYAVVISLFVTSIGLPVSLWIASRSPRWQTLLLSLVVLPKFASALAILFGWQQLLSSAGPFSQLAYRLGVTSEAVPLNRSPIAAMLAEVSMIVPYAIVVLYAQRLRIDPRLTVVAAGLGASPSQIFARVTLPLMVPGIRTVAALGFVWGMGAFLGPSMLAGPDSTTLAVQIHKTAMESSRWPLAAAQSVVLLSLVAFVAAAMRFATGRRWR